MPVQLWSVSQSGSSNCFWHLEACRSAAYRLLPLQGWRCWRCCGRSGCRRLRLPLGSTCAPASSDCRHAWQLCNCGAVTRALHPVSCYSHSSVRQHASTGGICRHSISACRMGGHISATCEALASCWASSACRTPPRCRLLPSSPAGCGCAADPVSSAAAQQSPAALAVPGQVAFVHRC